jgi:hypothetical protein
MLMTIIEGERSFAIFAETNCYGNPFEDISEVWATKKGLSWEEPSRD